MFFPKTHEYALRCMAQMALLPWESTVSSAEMAELTSVPKGYVSKVLLKLAKANLIVGEKGHGGGFKLALPPSSITFLRVLEASGFSFEPNRCISGWGQCNAKNPCPLHEDFSRLNTLFYTWASETTLADITRRQNPLRSISRSSKGQK